MGYNKVNYDIMSVMRERESIAFSVRAGEWRS